jgi:isopenicillin N synthase-like dioxygenase
VIPVIEIAPLFDADSSAWTEVDAELSAAARDIGFVSLRGLPGDLAPQAERRAELLRIFDLDDGAKRRLFRRKFAPGNRNVYRGWFPLQRGHLTYKEGLDLGGDVAYGPAITMPGDPLREETPLPAEDCLPGWRAAAATYYRAMEHLAEALMRSIARSLQLPQEYFDGYFRRGLSTLRLIRYPPRGEAELASVADPTLWVEAPATGPYLVGAPHTDSGFLTLLEQDAVAGLQVRSRDGRWIDVPALADTLVVNFGQVLEQWSAGRIRATEHRVLGHGRERHSIAFFYEARADAIIAPLPLDPPDAFEPFQYGDFLWNRITSFVEFRGMENERAPARPRSIP